MNSKYKYKFHMFRNVIIYYYASWCEVLQPRNKHIEDRVVSFSKG